MKSRLTEWVDGGVDPSFAAPYFDDLATIVGTPTLTRAVLPRDSTVEDRMPVGAYTNAGPADGTSTYFTDLADDLDVIQRERLAHEWWTRNPHWSYGVNGDGDPDLVDRVLTWETRHNTADLKAA